MPVETRCGTGTAGAPMCWLTIAWLIYGVGGIMVWGAKGCGMWEASPNACGLGESSIKFSDGLKSAWSLDCSDVAYAGLMG